MSTVDCRLAALYVHPVKSCAGLAITESPIVETGLDWDRHWMVTDPDGEMRTQRELPRMALVKPAFRGSDLVLRAPGMIALHLSLDTAETQTRARVWDDEVAAWDMGALAAQWFTDFLGRPSRLVRIDPEAGRMASRRWTGEVQAETSFADGFPLLVAGTASLADLNRRLAAQGQPPVGMERFRPNLVFDGLEAFDEDHVDEIRIEAEGGPVRIRLVKPCVRCSIPDVDPATAEPGFAVGDALRRFRADPRMDGGITFGMNAVMLEGVGLTLKVGAPATARLSF
jgi:uncharacterized protein YcbX